MNKLPQAESGQVQVQSPEALSELIAARIAHSLALHSTFIGEFLSLPDLLRFASVSPTFVEALNRSSILADFQSFLEEARDRRREEVEQAEFVAFWYMLVMLVNLIMMLINLGRSLPAAHFGPLENKLS